MGRGDKQSYRYFRSLGSPHTHNTSSLLLSFLCLLIFTPLSLPHCHLPDNVPTTFLPYYFLSLPGFWNCTADSSYRLNWYLRSAAPFPHVRTEDGHSDKLFNLILRWIFGFLSPYFFQYPCFLLENRISLEDTREHAFIQLALIVTRYT